MLVGDFDGNDISDVAYVEPIAGHQRLSIAYGTTDGLLPPIEVESFASVLALSVVGVPGSLDQSDIIDDIAVLDDQGGSPFLTALRGSAQRTMLSFFEPRSSKVDGVPVTANAELAGIVIGKFHDGDAPEAIVLGNVDSFDPVRATSPPGVYAWPMAITGDGLVSETDAYGAALPHFAACTGEVADPTAVCTNALVAAAVPLSATRDAIVAIDRSAPAPHAAIVIDGVVTLAPALVAGVPAGAVVRSIHAIGGSLVIAFGADAARAPGEVGLVETCPLAADGTLGACTDVGAAIAPGSTCVDAAPSDVGTVVLCYLAGSASADVYRADTGARIATGLAALRAITMGDVTGDGVDDLIGLAGETLVVYPQCATTDLECGP
jgi:hypothetical protein